MSDSALLVTSRAMWDARPTTGKRSERFLANAMGYPRSWRVVRRIVDARTSDTNDTNEESKNDANSTSNTDNADGSNTSRSSIIIVDRIYAGPPADGVDVYLNHVAAQTAALNWDDDASTGFEHKGGQLLPRKPKFQKGDNVKVLYDDEWCLATIKKRTERKSDGTFRYSVYYPEDGTTQGQVPEEDIQLVDDSEDPRAIAEEMGFGSEWQATCTTSKGKKRWTFTSPDGKTFPSKAAALRHKKKLEQQQQNPQQGADAKKSTSTSTKKKPKTPEELLSDEGDPPWRTTGHPYVGRRVSISSQHKKSATRTVTIEQVGTVLGWIADTDVDKHGNPGFVSERTNAPANLFHVVFDDEPSHPYFPLLVESQDLEEYELQNVLVPVPVATADEQTKEDNDNDKNSSK